jgi:hypothetical protein
MARLTSRANCKKKVEKSRVDEIFLPIQILSICMGQPQSSALEFWKFSSFSYKLVSKDRVEAWFPYLLLIPQKVFSSSRELCDLDHMNPFVESSTHNPQLGKNAL